MDREQMVERVVTVMLSEYIEEDLTPRAWDYMLAEKVLDAILPQVTTVEELEALPEYSVVIDRDNDAWQFIDGRWEGRLPEPIEPRWLLWYGPLTVVWRP